MKIFVKIVARMAKNNHDNLEPHLGSHQVKINWLRAAVLGANDGIVSIAGLVMGIAGVTNDNKFILTAGVAGILAGAISMAVGEYVSVSSSRDTEKSLLDKERYELKHFPAEELQELANIYEHKGLSKKTALAVAKELTDHDAFAAHSDVELKIDPDNLTNAYHAALASAISFFIGASIPLLAILLPPPSIKIHVEIISVVIALSIAGTLSAMFGGANIKKAVLRVVIGGLLAMSITYCIGKLFGVSV